MDKMILKYISLNPAIQHGKPCFRKTRTPVYVVLELLEAGLKPEQIVGKDYYPDLTLAHVRAALRFATLYAKNQQYLPFAKTN